MNKKFLTRQEIIDIWKEQSSLMLNSYCCPSCRDLLYEEEEFYYCNNENCSETVFYKENKEEENKMNTPLFEIGKRVNYTHNLTCTIINSYIGDKGKFVYDVKSLEGIIEEVTEEFLL